MEPNKKKYQKQYLIREVSNLGFNFILTIILAIIIDYYIFKNGISVIIGFLLAIARSAFNIYLLIKVSNDD